MTADKVRQLEALWLDAVDRFGCLAREAIEREREYRRAYEAFIEAVA